MVFEAIKNAIEQVALTSGDVQGSWAERASSEAWLPAIKQTPGKASQALSSFAAAEANSSSPKPIQQFDVPQAAATWSLVQGTSDGSSVAIALVEDREQGVRTETDKDNSAAIGSGNELDGNKSRVLDSNVAPFAGRASAPLSATPVDNDNASVISPVTGEYKPPVIAPSAGRANRLVTETLVDKRNSPVIGPVVGEDKPPVIDPSAGRVRRPLTESPDANDSRAVGPLAAEDKPPVIDLSADSGRRPMTETAVDSDNRPVIGPVVGENKPVAEDKFPVINPPLHEDNPVVNAKPPTIYPLLDKEEPVVNDKPSTIYPLLDRENPVVNDKPPTIYPLLDRENPVVNDKPPTINPILDKEKPVVNDKPPTIYPLLDKEKPVVNDKPPTIYPLLDKEKPVVNDKPPTIYPLLDKENPVVNDKPPTIYPLLDKENPVVNDKPPTIYPLLDKENPVVNDKPPTIYPLLDKENPVVNDKPPTIYPLLDKENPVVNDKPPTIYPLLDKENPVAEDKWSIESLKEKRPAHIGALEKILTTDAILKAVKAETLQLPHGQLNTQTTGRAFTDAWKDGDFNRSFQTESKQIEEFRIEFNGSTIKCNSPDNRTALDTNDKSTDSYKIMTMPPSGHLKVTDKEEPSPHYRGAPPTQVEVTVRKNQPQPVRVRLLNSLQKEAQEEGAGQTDSLVFDYRQFAPQATEQNRITKEALEEALIIDDQRNRSIKYGDPARPNPLKSNPIIDIIESGCCHMHNCRSGRLNRSAKYRRLVKIENRS